MLETIRLAHIHPHLPIYVTLYHSVQNAAFLRQQLLAGKSEFEYAFIDANMVRSIVPILFVQRIDHAQVDIVTNPYPSRLFSRAE
jgi:Kinase binding protein CGI-121